VNHFILVHLFVDTTNINIYGHQEFGEGLVVKQERDNRHDKYAVAVIKDGILALLATYREKSARMFTIS